MFAVPVYLRECMACLRQGSWTSRWLVRLCRRRLTPGSWSRGNSRTERSRKRWGQRLTGCAEKKTIDGYNLPIIVASQTLWRSKAIGPDRQKSFDHCQEQLTQTSIVFLTHLFKLIKNWRASLLPKGWLTWKSISPCLSCPTEYPREMRHDLNSSGASLPDLDLSKWLKEARNSFSCSWVMPLLSRVRIWFSTSLIVRFTEEENNMWFTIRHNHSLVFPREGRQGASKRPMCKSVTVIYFRMQWTWGGVILKSSVSCCLVILRCNSLSVAEIS